VRVDTFAHAECAVSPHYDSLVAKIMAHGRDRQEAIGRMRRTLEMTVIEGVSTTIPLHLKILADPDFAAGRLNTAFMDRYRIEPPGREGVLAAAAEPASPSTRCYNAATLPGRTRQAAASVPPRPRCAGG